MVRRMISRFAIVLLPALALAACGGGGEAEAPAPREADEATMRALPQGQVEGYVSQLGDDTAHAWLNIPFAQPPVGDLRWRAARAPEGWDGVREALDQPNWCPQYTNNLDEGQGYESGILMGDEDCLYLNVYAPPYAPEDVPTRDERLPVMVWIHGGGNVWGRAEQYDATSIAVRENVIVVVIQYRLGPLGWFAHPALRETAEVAIDRTANFGTFDQVAALAWVHDSIAAFGGDPANVTIFGESAGGHNVASLLVAPQAAGLFQQAIIQSGSAATVPLAIAEGSEPDPLNRGLTTSADAINSVLAFIAPPTPDQMAGAMRTIDMPVLFQAYRDLSTAGLGIDPPRVIGDGIVLPEDGILAGLERMGPFNPVPVMTGTNRDETKLFNALDERFVNRWLGGIIIRPKDQRLFDLIAEYQTAIWQVKGVDSIAGALRRSGRDDVFAYRFDWDEEGSFLFTDFSTLLGAAHGWEIPFVFNRWELGGRLDRFLWTDDNAEGRRTLSDAMMGYWANFARTGNPGAASGNPAWEPWEGGQRIILDTPDGGGIRMEQGAYTITEVMDRLATDERLTSDEERCTVYAAVLGWYPDVAVDGFAGGACASGGSEVSGE